MLRSLATLLAPMLGGLVVVVLLVASNEHARERELALETGRGVLTAATQTLQLELGWLASTLAFVAEDPHTAEALRASGAPVSLSEHLQRLARTDDTVDAIHLVDAEGRERVCVTREGGAEVRATATANDEAHAPAALADVALTDAMHLSARLVRDAARPTDPVRLVLRGIDPVYSANGQREGALVVDYRGDWLLGQLELLAHGVGADLHLLDAVGNHLDRHASGGASAASRAFGATHPSAWDELRRAESGNAIDGGRLFVFGRLADAVAGLEADHDLELFLVTSQPTQTVAQGLLAFTRRVAPVVGLGLVVLLAVCWRHAMGHATRARQRAALLASEGRLRTLSARLVHAQEDERRRISRELHDGIGQLATMTTIELKRAGSAPTEERRRAAIERALAGSQEVLDATRRLGTDLRTRVLDDHGLVAALEGRFEALRADGLRVDAHLEVDEDRLPPAVRDHAYRLVSEALTNVARHAGCDEAHVVVADTERGLELSIRDEGRGFRAADVHPDRLGLVGMRERVDLLGGRFELDTLPGRGTRLRVLLPHRGAVGEVRR